MKHPANPVRIVACTLGLLAPLGAGLEAQRLTLTPNVASPGTSVRGELFNNTEGAVFYVRSCEVRTLRHSGEFVHVSTAYVSPRTVLLTEACDQVVPLAPGETREFFFEAPSLPGSYTVITADTQRAAARLVVSSPTAGAQDVCFYPTGVSLPQTAHQVDFATPRNTTWEFANIGSSPHEFAVGDRIRLFTPGSTTPVATLDLAGITVLPRLVTEIELPLGGLLPGPYQVEASFVDASAGPVVTRSGIQPRGVRVDLHMHEGRELALGTPLGMSIGVTGFSPTADDPYYYLVLGLQPGTTPLPGGIYASVVAADPLVRASLATGLGGLLVNNIGRVQNVNPFGSPFFAGGVDDISLTHPALAGLSGLVVRVGVVVSDADMQVWGASQPEEIVLQ